MNGPRTATTALREEIVKALRAGGIGADTGEGRPGWHWKDLFAARADVTLVWNGADPYLRNLAADAGVMRLQFLVSMHGNGEMAEAALRAIRAHLSSAAATPVAAPRSVRDQAPKKEEVKKIGFDFGISVRHIEEADVPGAGKWRLSLLEQSPEQLQGVWRALRRRMRPSLVVLASEVLL
jgi:hypothetical protein